MFELRGSLSQVLWIWIIFFQDFLLSLAWFPTQTTWLCDLTHPPVFTFCKIKEGNVPNHMSTRPGYVNFEQVVNLLDLYSGQPSCDRSVILLVSFLGTKYHTYMYVKFATCYQLCMLSALHVISFACYQLCMLSALYGSHFAHHIWKGSYNTA